MDDDSDEKRHHGPPDALFSPAQLTEEIIRGAVKISLLNNFAKLLAVPAKQWASIKEAARSGSNSTEYNMPPLHRFLIQQLETYRHNNAESEEKGLTRDFIDGQYSLIDAFLKWSGDRTFKKPDFKFKNKFGGPLVDKFLEEWNAMTKKDRSLFLTDWELSQSNGVNLNPLSLIRRFRTPQPADKLQGAAMRLFTFLAEGSGSTDSDRNSDEDEKTPQEIPTQILDEMKESLRPLDFNRLFSLISSIPDKRALGLKYLRDRNIESFVKIFLENQTMPLEQLQSREEWLALPEHLREDFMVRYQEDVKFAISFAKNLLLRLLPPGPLAAVRIFVRGTQGSGMPDLSTTDLTIAMKILEHGGYLTLPNGGGVPRQGDDGRPELFPEFEALEDELLEALSYLEPAQRVGLANLFLSGNLKRTLQESISALRTGDSDVRPGDTKENQGPKALGIRRVRFVSTSQGPDRGDRKIWRVQVPDSGLAKCQSLLSEHLKDVTVTPAAFAFSGIAAQDQSVYGPPGERFIQNFCTSVLSPDTSDQKESGGILRMTLQNDTTQRWSLKKAGVLLSHGDVVKMILRYYTEESEEGELRFSTPNWLLNEPLHNVPERIVRGLEKILTVPKSFENHIQRLIQINQQTPLVSYYVILLEIFLPFLTTLEDDSEDSRRYPFAVREQALNGYIKPDAYMAMSSEEKYPSCDIEKLTNAIRDYIGKISVTVLSRTLLELPGGRIEGPGTSTWVIPQLTIKKDICAPTKCLSELYNDVDLVWYRNRCYPLPDLLIQFYGSQISDEFDPDFVNQIKRNYGHLVTERFTLKTGVIKYVDFEQYMQVHDFQEEKIFNQDHSAKFDAYFKGSKRVIFPDPVAEVTRIFEMVGNESAFRCYYCGRTVTKEQVIFSGGINSDPPEDEKSISGTFGSVKFIKTAFCSIDCLSKNKENHPAGFEELFGEFLHGSDRPQGDRPQDGNRSTDEKGLPLISHSLKPHSKDVLEITVKGGDTYLISTVKYSPSSHGPLQGYIQELYEPAMVLISIKKISGDGDRSVTEIIPESQMCLKSVEFVSSDVRAQIADVMNRFDVTDSDHQHEILMGLIELLSVPMAGISLTLRGVKNGIAYTESGQIPLIDFADTSKEPEIDSQKIRIQNIRKTIHALKYLKRVIYGIAANSDYDNQTILSINSDAQAGLRLDKFETRLVQLRISTQSAHVKENLANMRKYLATLPEGDRRDEFVKAIKKADKHLAATHIWTKDQDGRDVLKIVYGVAVGYDAYLNKALLKAETALDVINGS